MWIKKQMKTLGAAPVNLGTCHYIEIDGNDMGFALVFVTADKAQDYIDNNEPD